MFVDIFVGDYVRIINIIQTIVPKKPSQIK